MPIGSLIVAVALAQSAPAVAPSEYERALKCRAYAPVMIAFLTREQTEKLKAYWLGKTEALGKVDGKTPQQVEMATLVIPIEAKDADAVLAGCLEAWAADPKSKKPL